MRRLAILLVLLAGTPVVAQTTRVEDAALRYAVPTAWKRVPAPSDVRAAQYTIPHADGDADDGELILFFFGAGQGGGVDENLNRWYGQFTEPDNRPPRDAAVVTIRTVKDLRVTAVDLSGTYVGMQGRGQGPSKPGYRMLAAVVEGPGGPWFWKATGAEKTMAGAKPDFDRLLASLDHH